MNLVVHPGNPLRGVISLPGDKSLSHRAALLAAIAAGESRIDNFLRAGVTEAMLEALTCLGVKWNLENAKLTVQGNGLEGLQPPAKPIYCGNSATTLRLLAGVIAAAGIPATLDGGNQLRHRPMQRIIQPLMQMGIVAQSNQGCAPISMQASRLPLSGITYQLPVASAQLKSCLLLAGLSADSVVKLIEPAPSRDHTERMLRSMGASINTSTQRSADGKLYQTVLHPHQPVTLSPLGVALPGDISSAAFLIGAALITPGSQLMIKDVGLNPTRTGILDILIEMGADIRLQTKTTQAGEPVGNIFVSHSNLMGGNISGDLVVRMIDEFPIFGVVAAYARSPSIVSQAGELRFKESDRIGSLGVELVKLGVKFEETSDGFRVEGGKGIQGGQVNSHHDHRLAMALVVAGLASQEGVIVQGAEALHESFPDFVTVLRTLGADITEADGE